MKQAGFFHSFHEPHFHFERTFKYPVRSFSVYSLRGVGPYGPEAESQVTLSRVEGERVVKYFFQLKGYTGNRNHVYPWPRPDFTGQA
jgi:hypothetical protein